MYVMIQDDDMEGRWRVGFFKPDNTWVDAPEMGDALHLTYDCVTASYHVHWLNGGDDMNGGDD